MYMTGLKVHFFIFTIVIYRTDTAIKYTAFVCVWCDVFVCVATSTHLLLHFDFNRRRRIHICIAGTSNLWEPVIIGLLCNI